MELISISRDDLAEMMAEAVRKEIQPIKQYISTVKIPSKEAMSLLGISSFNTFKKLIDEGKINSYPDSPGSRYHKFSLYEIIEFSKSYKKYA